MNKSFFEKLNKLIIDAIQNGTPTMEIILNLETMKTRLILGLADLDRQKAEECKECAWYHKEKKECICPNNPKDCEHD